MSASSPTVVGGLIFSATPPPPGSLFPLFHGCYRILFHENLRSPLLGHHLPTSDAHHLTPDHIMLISHHSLAACSYPPSTFAILTTGHIVTLPISNSLQYLNYHTEPVNWITKQASRWLLHSHGCFFASSSSIQDNWGKCDDILAFGSGYCWLLPPTKIFYDWLPWHGCWL